MNDLLTKKQIKEMKRQEKEARQKREKAKGKIIKATFAIASLLAVAAVIMMLSRTANRGIGPDIDPVKGADSAKVVIEEYSDFQCPACANALEIINKLLSEYPEDIKLVFNDFPSVLNHKNAFAAAEAAQCAYRQEKFWEMHDLLFEQQAEWAQETKPRDIFKKYAGELGLNQSGFDECLNRGQTAGQIKKDIKEGLARQVAATPTFFVNGQKIEGADYQKIKEAINKILKTQNL